MKDGLLVGGVVLAAAFVLLTADYVLTEGSPGEVAYFISAADIVGDDNFTWNSTTRLLELMGTLNISGNNHSDAINIGLKEDGLYQYIDLDTEASPPPASDCDNDTEIGRMIIDHTGSPDNRLWICFGAVDGWQSEVFS